MKKDNNPAKIKFRKRVALNLFARYRKNMTALHDLTYIFWECTLRCNLNCVHCGSDCLKQSELPDMPLADFLKALDSATKLCKPEKTMIALTGGEPLMRQDLEECGRAFMQRGFPWGMVTNGYILDEKKLVALINAGLRSVTVSLDGLESSHNWFRGNDKSFEKSLMAVELIARSGITYDVATCVYHDNLTELDEIYNLLLNAGVKYWRLFTIFPRGRAKDNDRLKPNKDMLITLFEFIKEKKAEGKMNITYGCEGFLGNYEGEVRDGFFFCRAGVNVASVLIDGSISACPSLRSDFIQGNIYTDDFAEVWQSRYQVMRDRNWTKTGLCADCNEYNWCCGNGLHLRDESDGSLMFCHLREME
jgi:radical SAM enzyme (rSAM/lipoprotein system)